MKDVPASNELPPGWLPLDYSHAPVICPMTGDRLPDDPRDLEGLRAYRFKLHNLCKDDLLMQRKAWQLSRANFSWWANAFVCTPAGMKFVAGRQISQPLKLTLWRHWPVDDELDRKYELCRDTGRSLMVPKSRDMRATLHMLIRYVHNFLFRPRWYGLMLANVMKLVDGSEAGPEALMPRCRTILKMLPAWQTYGTNGELIWDSRHCVITNLANGACIGGTASTEEPGTGMRPTEMLFDEAAKNRNFGEAWEQSAHSTKLRVAVSTYKGPERFSRLDEEGVEVATMLYYNHPDKGQGREFRTNTNPFYPVKVGKRFVWSPTFHYEVWNDEKQAPIQTTTGVAQNVFADKAAGSSGFFDGDVLLVLEQRAAKVVPEFVGGIARKMEPSPERDAAIIAKKPGLISLVRVGESFKWWGQLGGRPQQDRTYCMFADISQGRGSSNSVLAIGCVETASVVGMYVASDFDPSEFARQMVEIGLWVGGKGGPPLMGWEVNGPGEGLGRVFQGLKYTRLWSADGDELGWRSDSGAKEEAANTLAMTLQTDSLRIDEPLFYREAQDWAYLTSTTVGCVKTHKDPHAKATHGDRVVAVMGLNIMMSRFPKPKPQTPDLPGHVDMGKWQKSMERLGYTKG